MTVPRLERLDDLVRELSVQDDPERLIRTFGRHADMVLRRDGLVSVSRRDLQAPAYRITRSWRWHDPINPWTETHRLPMLEGGLLGDLLYSGKPLIMNRLEIP